MTYTHLHRPYDDTVSAYVIADGSMCCLTGRAVLYCSERWPSARLLQHHARLYRAVLPKNCYAATLLLIDVIAGRYACLVCTDATLKMRNPFNSSVTDAATTHISCYFPIAHGANHRVPCAPRIHSVPPDLVSSWCKCSG
jgi:hypothetical protein